MHGGNTFRVIVPTFNHVTSPRKTTVTSLRNNSLTSQTINWQPYQLIKVEEDDAVEQEPVVTHILPRRELTSTSTMIRMLIAREQLESSYERIRPTSPIPSRTGISRDSIEEEARRLSLTAIQSAFSAAVSLSEGGCRASYKGKRNIWRGLMSCFRSCFSCVR